MDGDWLAEVNQNWTSKLGFKPFVGPEYRDGLVGGLKVLLLGESHYHDGDASRQFTIDEYSDYIRPDYDLLPASEFFGKLQRLAARNADATAQDSILAWRRLAFMNFVQGIVGPDASFRPTATMWRTGEPALSEVIRVLEPDVVLVMGKLVWNRINEGRAAGPPSIPGTRVPRDVWLIPHVAGNAYCSWIYHPARNLEKSGDAITVFSALLRLAGDAKHAPVD